MIDFIKDIALEAGKIALKEQKKLTSAKIHSKSSVKDIVCLSAKI